ncbi:helix-turn-helix domain-containing protein [Enterococcus faecalis]|nr:helix-turn-helix domain-containing protein [Enterococcus faecalis]
MEKQMLTSFSDHQRTDAMKKYKIIEPYLNKQETIKEISIKNKIPIRTLYRWVQKYEHDGLVGLIRKTRTQEGKQWHRANNKNYREGRPKRVLNDKYKHALELMETNSMREVEKKTGISLSTLKRIKKQAKEEQLFSEK